MISYESFDTINKIVNNKYYYFTYLNKSQRLKKIKIIGYK